MNTRLFVDFLTLTFKVEDNVDAVFGRLNNYSTVLENEYKIKGNVVFFKKRFNSSIFKRHIDIPLNIDDLDKIITIGYDHKSGDKNSFWLALNPSRFTNEDFRVLRKHFKAIFSKYDLQNMYKNGIVTRLDLTVDLPELSLDGLFLDVADLRCGQINTDSTGLITSQHLGSRRSPLFVNVYSKPADQEGNPVRTRVECRMKRIADDDGQKATLSNLVNVLRNPFNRIVAYQLPDHDENAWLYKLVLAGARAQGLKSVLQLLPLNERRRVRTYLKQYRVELFDADSVWATLPDALAVLEQLYPRKRHGENAKIHRGSAHKHAINRTKAA